MAGIVMSRGAVAPPATRREPLAAWARPLLLPGLALAAALPCIAFGRDAQVGLLVLSVGFGLIHGGRDHEVARTLLAPRWGRVWPLPFLAAYLGLGGMVLATWALAPECALLAFLLLSALHFGGEDGAAHGGTDIAGAFAIGGAVVVIPALAHPAALTTLFGWLIGDTAPHLLHLLARPVACVWMVCVARLLVHARDDAIPMTLELAATALLFLAAPPLVAFALYFAIVHTPRALAAQAQSPCHAGNASWHRGLPLAALACLGGLLVWALRPADAFAPATIRTLFPLLSALAIPHMMLDWLAARATFGNR